MFLTPAFDNPMLAAFIDMNLYALASLEAY